MQPGAARTEPTLHPHRRPDTHRGIGVNRHAESNPADCDYVAADRVYNELPTAPTADRVADHLSPECDDAGILRGHGCPAGHATRSGDQAEEQHPGGQWAAQHHGKRHRGEPPTSTA
jgi:hypothetical protein